MYTRFITIAILGAMVAGCGGDPVDAAGQYTVTVTNGDNGCNFENWTVGESSAGIPVVITQDGSAISAEVQGIAGLFLDLLLGSRVYTGEIEGDTLSLIIYGTNSAIQGNCTYTVNSELIADVDGDFLTGQIRYQAATVGNPDCALLEGCATIQNFNGNRPPM